MVKILLLVGILLVTGVNAYYAGNALYTRAWSIASLYGFLTVVGFGYFVKWKRDL